MDLIGVSVHVSFVYYMIFIVGTFDSAFNKAMLAYVSCFYGLQRKICGVKYVTSISSYFYFYMFSSKSRFSGNSLIPTIHSV